jgi:hypothetical protein
LLPVDGSRKSSDFEGQPDHSKMAEMFIPLGLTGAGERALRAFEARDGLHGPGASSKTKSGNQFRRGITLTGGPPFF